MAKVSTKNVATQKTVIAQAEEKFFDFAEDLGRFYGHAETRAKAWMDQRQAVLAQLTTLRDKASQLISTIAGSDHAEAPAARRGRPPGTARKNARMPAKRKPARATKAVATKGRSPGRKKGSTMSKAARDKIAAAQRARWAKVRAEKGDS